MPRFPRHPLQPGTRRGTAAAAGAPGGASTPHSRPWLALLLWAGVLAGCQTAGPSAWPSFATAPTPHLAAQTALLQEARDHLRGGRAEPAVQLLRSLMDRYPDSPLRPDMRWWLGRAYELAGDPEAAAVLYRQLIRDGPATEASRRRLIAPAQRRLAALRPLLASRQPAPTTGLLVAPDDVPADPDRAAWMDALVRAGIRALVLEAASPPTAPGATPTGTAAQEDPGHEPASGVYFRTAWAPVIDDLLEQVVPVAHERGVAVYAALSLRRLSWLEPPAGWADTSFDPERDALRPTRALDLFHPGYQQYLEGLLLDLADSGVDGVIFRATHPLGPTDGLSPFAQHAFQRAFRLPVEPHRWFRDLGTTPGDGPADDRLIFESADRHPPAYWRWVGWKARERLAVLTRLAERVRAHRADATVSLEVHAGAVLEPTEALVAYAEDVVAVARAGFDHVLVPHEAAVPATPAAPATGQPPVAGDPSLTGVARLIELLGDPSRLWLVRTTDASTARRLAQGRLLPGDRPAVPRPVGVLFVPRPGSRS